MVSRSYDRVPETVQHCTHQWVYCEAASGTHLLLLLSCSPRTLSPRHRLPCANTRKHRSQTQWRSLRHNGAPTRISAEEFSTTEFSSGRDGDNIAFTTSFERIVVHLNSQHDAPFTKAYLAPSSRHCTLNPPLNARMVFADDPPGLVSNLLAPAFRSLPSFCAILSNPYERPAMYTYLRGFRGTCFLEHAVYGGSVHSATAPNFVAYNLSQLLLS